MKRFLMVMLTIIWGALLCADAIAADKTKYPLTPKLNQGKKWRIGYLEGGKFKNYPMILSGIVTALSDMGWIEKVQLPSVKDDAGALWKWLSEHVKSNYIEFVPGAFWTSNWDKELRKTTRASVIKRLKEMKDIDLMIAMGTWAGQDLANNEHSIPTVVCSTSNPIQSNIIKSAEDSGYNHLHARVDPTRYERQVRLFHEIIGFKKLGIAYCDSEAGRSYAALNEIEKVAKERGFDIIRCFVQPGTPEVQTDSTEKCHHELAEKGVDAVYITMQTGVTLKSLPRLMAPLNKRKIPTFAQGGSEEVKHGVLMSIAQAGERYVSRFHAETIAQIFNGAKPRDLPQLFEDPPKIAINLAEAHMIGYDPPVDILGSADEIFQEIQTPK